VEQSPEMLPQHLVLTQVVVAVVENQHMVVAEAVVLE
jgi:hypothetical protein